MKPDDDAALRAALAEAHQADAGRRPSFERALEASRRGGRPRPSPWTWLVTCGTLAAAAGLSLWLLGRPGSLPAQPTIGMDWRGPTDFLLETPDAVTLRTLPNLMTSFPLPLLPPDANPSRRGNP
jgi:hypothetical protein